MICGMGSSNVWKVPVDDGGSMKADALRELVVRANEQGKTPLYVNTTAGSTVRGSYDPFEDISKICKEFGLWMHIDASWGGPVVFSAQQRWKVEGSHLADSITINPHKMLNAPTTCSFLLGPDMSLFNKANTTDAGYLFHGSTEDDVWDLADLTLQCGRRGDSLKVALAWLYYGANGFRGRLITHSIWRPTCGNWCSRRAISLWCRKTRPVPPSVLLSTHPTAICRAMQRRTRIALRPWLRN